ncbi:rhodanese-like domain-containing protein [Metabacillus sediminilitoris]|uniref:Rhodanese-like domain-containing protein n=1 Tax=Metabacillus sediminilitoris TaxID=2567941 RepID=A0A4S4C2T4_9BACI|nr:rhodanese-like domain-containing protein [Metabacillus sediminilitoris]QGQ47580.1 rhodanese-like domain-containing protein [Metabacillus sediminilitoris]THF82013.1 rhodanese-like domain-containing protein [Metabacillus sediminilitoris]
MYEMKEISPEEIQKKLVNGENVELIDVREDDEVETGMIPQARHIRMNDIPEQLDAIDKDKETIFICRSGARSGNVCAYLQEKGYNVINMAGGMLEYKGETKPKSELGK